MPTTLQLTCVRCRIPQPQTSLRCLFHFSTRWKQEHKPTSAPKQSINIKHIRENAAQYEQNCLERNYKALHSYPARINALQQQWHGLQHSASASRVRKNKLDRALANPAALQNDESPEVQSILSFSREDIISELRELKDKVSAIDSQESVIWDEIETLAASLPNLTSEHTPRGDVPTLLGYLHSHPDSSASPRLESSHVDIGHELQLVDFSSAATTSGWGWYYLLNGAAKLEQALIQYALSRAESHGFKIVSPPTMVYSHIASACGFQPRDTSGEQQIYSISQSASDAGRKPEYSLAGTAEIPLASMKASQAIDEDELPLRTVAVSRCYRAEAGARGVDTKGLYRVHEFSKVELFAWTLPSASASSSMFSDMLALQTDILTSLNLHCRLLEMPSTDLGASATRKNDIEAFFPGRRKKDEGWGEVTSVSECSDYQSRRLATKVKMKSAGGKTMFPYTVNGTAMAVPRVLAAILENGWDEEKREVKVPEVLWPWMGGMKVLKKERKVAVETVLEDHQKDLLSRWAKPS